MTGKKYYKGHSKGREDKVEGRCNIGDKKKSDVKRGRSRYKACDPFSGRGHKKANNDSINLEPDNDELVGYEDTTNDSIDKYSSYREKPKYRKDIIFADELDDMKTKRKEKKSDTSIPEMEGRYVGESLGMFRKRMRQDRTQILIDEVRKARKTSDKKKRYSDKKKVVKSLKSEWKNEEKKEKEDEIRAHTIEGFAEQAERPPQLSTIISKMLQSNKVFEKEKEKLKLKESKIDRKAALSVCRHNMNRFD